MENALQGKFLSRTAPIGYRIDQDHVLQLDPETAPFVKKAFERYAEGLSIKSLRDWLNSLGIKSCHGNKVTYNMIHKMLHNRRYIGEYHYRDLVVPNGHPAIVDFDLFERVQKRLQANKLSPARYKA